MGRAAHGADEPSEGRGRTHARPSRQLRLLDVHAATPAPELERVLVERGHTQPRFEEGVHFQRYGDGNRFRYVFNIDACKQRLQHLNNAGQQATAEAMAKARDGKKA